MKKSILFLFVFLFFAIAGNISAQNLGSALNVVYLQSGQNVQINNPETSQAFYDELKGKPRDYFIDSNKDFELYINLSVPNPTNKDGRYSADIYLIKDNKEQKIDSLDGVSYDWQEFYNSSSRDYYLKGPEFDKKLSAGKYKIEIWSKDNQGKYILVTGKKEAYNIISIINTCWQLPLLKVTFFKTSISQFFLTPFGIGSVSAIGAFLILLALINYFIGVIKQIIKHNRAKTLLLTSNGMQMKNEIIRLLQKPAYDVTVAFISTAAKSQENLDYVKKDWDIMRDEMGFNVEEIDIENKGEGEVTRLLQFKDIIYIEGGNTYYLLNAMRKCNFEKIIKKLLKDGKVYIGSSAGSIVAGRTIRTAGWVGDQNIVKIKKLKGLNLLPFDIFVHYKPEYAEIIKKNMPFKWQRKKLKILTDEQAILVQGREVDLIGRGDAVII